MITDNLTEDTFQQGRKGVAYDWQGLFAAAEVEALESELSQLAPEYAE